jgi:protein SCO1
MRSLVALALALAHAAAFAQALAPTPSAPAAAFTQHLGGELPLDAPFTDSAGHAVRLVDELARAGGPTLLMLGYHRCPQLCGLATQGVLEALRQGGMSAAQVLFVSVDPTETAADAADRRRADLGYARLLAGGKPVELPAIERLVGPPASIAALARSVGFVYQPGDAAARFSHPAGLVVVTPVGRISRYLMGVRFDPAQLRTALLDARAGAVGPPSDRLALLCAHFDPRIGAHSQAVMMGMRAAGIAALAWVAALAWRRRGVR